MVHEMKYTFNKIFEILEWMTAGKFIQATDEIVVKYYFIYHKLEE